MRLHGTGDSMRIKRLIAVSVAACAIALAGPAAIALGDTGTQAIGNAGPAQPSAKEYQNCTKLNKVYPHGVGKPNAVDKVRAGSPRVTNFKKSLPLYRANDKSDRDGDGIACEKL